MMPWASDLHRRLWMQGHNELEQQQIIDRAALNWLDPVALGMFLASQNMRQLDNLNIEIPPVPWYVELKDTVVHIFRLAWSVVKYGW